MTGSRGDDNLTGVWDGLFNWPNHRPATPFTAVLLETGGALSGSVHEIAQGGAFDGRELTALLSGRRTGSQVSFVKTYAAKPVRFRPVAYEGALNAEATEIDGTWTIRGGTSGRFLMTRSRRPAEEAAIEAKEAAPAD